MSEKMAVVLKKDSVAPPSPYDLANKTMNEALQNISKEEIEIVKKFADKLL